MKIIFAGTSAFAVPSLTQLIQASQKNSAYELIGVYTQPDRPCGRGRKIQSSPVKQLAQQNALPIYQPITLKNLAVQKQFEDLQPNVIIVVAYGLIIPQSILSIPNLGCINVHASLLPRWRGAAPVQRALLSGDLETGVSIMEMEATLDTGPVLTQKSMAILPQDTSGILQTRLANLGATALLDTLHSLAEKQSQSKNQINSHACYAAKITKEEAAINWHEAAIVIERKIRAFDPYPIAFTWLKEHRIRCWKASVESPMIDNISYEPGQIVSISKQGIVVATGENYLRLLELQLEGGRRLSVAQLLNAKLGWIRSNMLFTSVK